MGARLCDCHKKKEKGSIKMKIIRTKNYEDMSRKAAAIIAAQVVHNPECVLGLATGGTPVGTYKNLVEWYNNGDIDFSAIHTVNLDEYRALPVEHPESYWSFMHRNLFNHVNIKPENINLPDGNNMDAAAECARYDAVIASMGGVDLQLLGIGHDGHIGFNEPCDEFVKGTHKVELTQMTIDANARFFESEELVPRSAYTMGTGTIMNAKKVLMIAAGKDKAAILKKAFFGPVTPQVPASILQMHPNFVLVADEDALSLI